MTVNEAEFLQKLCLKAQCEAEKHAWKAGPHRGVIKNEPMQIAALWGALGKSIDA